MTLIDRTPATLTSAPVLIMGCGDIGCRVARLEQAEGRTVAALARSPETASRLGQRGITAINGDLDKPERLTALPPHVSTLYYFAPPPSAGDDDPRIHHALSALALPPARLVYIGTSGVYGDCGGAWIDEDWPLTQSP